jgi:hypothetical protein
VTRWTLRLAAYLAVGTVVLTGCSEKQEASHTLPTTSAAETTESLPPVGPAAFPVPAEARQKTPEGALAFGKYYIALGTEIGKGNVPSQALLDLSTPECRLCNQVAASFAEDQAAGYKHVGGSYSFKEYGPGFMSEGGDVAELGFDYTQGADSVVDANGQDVPSRAGKESGLLRSGMRLDWRDDLHSWLVANLTIG